MSCTAKAQPTESRCCVPCKVRPRSLSRSVVVHEFTAEGNIQIWMCHSSNSKVARCQIILKTTGSAYFHHQKCHAQPKQTTQQRELFTCTSLQLCHSDNAREEDGRECQKNAHCAQHGCGGDRWATFGSVWNWATSCKAKKVHWKCQRTNTTTSSHMKLSIASGTGCTTSWKGHSAQRGERFDLGILQLKTLLVSSGSAHYPMTSENTKHVDTSPAIPQFGATSTINILNHASLARCLHEVNVELKAFGLSGVVHIAKLWSGVTPKCEEEA